MKNRQKKTVCHFVVKRASLPLFIILVSLFGFLLVQKNTVEARSTSPKQLRIIIHHEFHRVCDLPIAGMAECDSHVVSDTNGVPLNSLTPLSSSYGPVQFHTAYNLPCTPKGIMQSICLPPATYGSQTIAIITAYNDPNIENDLNTYNSYYGLPLCTKANGCLTVINQNGGTTLPSKTNSGWALETSLDVEMSHMVCQTCKILLVESSSSSITNLATAVNRAALLGVTAISNSYGASEWSAEGSYDSYYNHPGIAVTVSSGDSGFGGEFPAASHNVVAVGGTTLQLHTDNTYANENVWNGTGSGCSTYESANSWQTEMGDWSQTLCGASRGIVDVSADADPNTGAAVYDSVPYSGMTGWYQVGGTSLAAPLIAGIYALTGGVPTGVNAASLPYTGFVGTNFHDITTGTNGVCSSTMCIAGIGYDGPSGLGSPSGYGGFTQVLFTPTPSVPVTPTAIPTVSPTPSFAPIPTGSASSPSPTPIQAMTFGYMGIGSSLDSFDANYIDGSRFKMGPTNGLVQSISAYVGSVDIAPYNQFQVSIYSDEKGRPGSLLAKSTAGVLTANAWNMRAISATLKANTYYWLMYNTNASSVTLNNLHYNATSSFVGSYSASGVSFGIWPQSFTAKLDGYQYSLYATYTPL